MVYCNSDRDLVGVPGAGGPGVAWHRVLRPPPGPRRGRVWSVVGLGPGRVMLLQDAAGVAPGHVSLELGPPAVPYATPRPAPTTQGTRGTTQGTSGATQGARGTTQGTRGTT